MKRTNDIAAVKIAIGVVRYKPHAKEVRLIQQMRRSMKRVREEKGWIKEGKKVIKDENQIQTSEGQMDQLLSSQKVESMRRNGHMLVQQLMDFCGSNKIVEIYTSELSPSKFIACFLLAMSSNHMLLALIHVNGYYEGFSVLPLSDVLRMDVSTKYCDALQKLWDETAIRHDPIEQKEENQLSNLLLYALKKQKVESIELLESGSYDVAGYITSFEGSEIRIKKIGEYGEFEGVSVIHLDDVTHVACDREDERKLDRLWKISEKACSSSAHLETVWAKGMAYLI